MHRRISSTLNALRQDLSALLGSDVIHDACRAVGHTWSASALLTPAAIIHWFLIQVFHGNTALNHVTLLAGRVFTDSAFCQARARLPLAVFRAVLRAVLQVLVPDTQKLETRWLGLRPFLLDGSSFSMPDTAPLQAHFGQPGNQAKGCGFPVAHLLALFHAGTGLLLEVFAAPLRSHDMAGITAILPFLTAGDVLVADRGLCSFAHLALLMSQGVHAVFRLHQKQIVDFTPGRAHARPGQKRAPKGIPRSRWVRACGLRDQVVEYFKPARCPVWLGAAAYRKLPESIMVRELRYRITVPGFRTREVTLGGDGVRLGGMVSDFVLGSYVLCSKPRTKSDTMTRPKSDTMTRPKSDTMTRPKSDTMTRPHDTTMTRTKSDTMTRSDCRVSGGH